MKVVLAPDVFVNASVAGGSSPQRVAQKVLEDHKGEAPTSEWILARVEAMLAAHPDFKKDAIPLQMQTIRGLVKIVDVGGAHEPGDWEKALDAAAKSAGVTRVITDHPDLVDKEGGDVEYVSTEAWLIEESMPPPPPGKGS